MLAEDVTGSNVLQRGKLDESSRCQGAQSIWAAATQL